jgi:hypothetical protein
MPPAYLAIAGTDNAPPAGARAGLARWRRRGIQAGHPMEPAPLPGADAQLAAWLASERIDASYAAFVARHVDADDATWRWCCGSSCDPCVQRLGRVVDLVRAARCPRPE